MSSGAIFILGVLGAIAFAVGYARLGPARQRQLDDGIQQVKNLFWIVVYIIGIGLVAVMLFHHR